ncbi:MAG: hypothetical protein HZB46_01620 [Solirubrobacterales bacterium]|nr:hypothetical protein [Solirubrobacterales bacterium]
MDANVLQWDGTPGHYEVHYLTCTDPATGWGLWIRYTMRAPLDGPAEAHLWFLAMRADGRRVARKATLPIDALTAEPDPFRLRIGEAELRDDGAGGEVDGARWDLRWSSALPPAEHVHPLLRRLKVAKTVLVLPQPKLAVSGTVSFEDVTIDLDGVHGGQAHLWGSKHAARWAWAHCGDFRTHEGGPVDGQTFVDGVSVVVPRFGREVGPSTPVVGRFLGEDFRATSPATVLRSPSRFGLTSWHCEAVDGKRKAVIEVDAPRESLAGVTYHDPDGDLAYCYNSEVASMRVGILDKRARGRFGWVLRDTLVADGTAHFEYAQRSPVSGVELLTS